jgi:cytidylate kinase
MKYYAVAIDGPAGSGKSTVAKQLARRLHFTYVDTGAMYRAVAWRSIIEEIDPTESEKIALLAEKIDFSLHQRGMLIDGERLQDQLRLPEVSSRASTVAKIAGVREALVRKQQQIAASHHVVMDGRDVGTRVIPKADVKIFLTASIEERARRRYQELQKKGHPMALDRLVEEIKQRDHNDQTRAHSPLVQAEDAIRIDTTHLTIQQVVQKILAICDTKIGGDA